MRALYFFAILFRCVCIMAAPNQQQENPSVQGTIEGESSTQSSLLSNAHGRDLVNRIFHDPEALSMLREAIFFRTKFWSKIK